MAVVEKGVQVIELLYLAIGVLIAYAGLVNEGKESMELSMFAWIVITGPQIFVACRVEYCLQGVLGKKVV